MSQAAPDLGPAREGETLTRLLVEQMPALLWSTDRDLKLTSWMGGLARLASDADRAVGLTLFEFFHTQDERFRPIASHRQALAGESVLYEGDWMGRTLATHLEPLRDAAGAVVGVIGVGLDITERKRAEGELQRSLALLRATLDSTADGILVVDDGGRIVTYNRRFVQMWRIPEEIAASGDDSRALAFVLDQLKDPGRFVTRTMGIYAQPGEESYDWLEFKDARVFERYSQPHQVGGAIVGRVWSFRDVTDRARLEEILRRHARTVEHVFDAVVVTDLAGRIIDWNPGAERLFGHSKEAMLGKTPAVLHADAAAKTGQILDAVRRHGRWAGELPFLRSGGSEGVCDTIAVAHNDDYGCAIAVILIHRERPVSSSV